MTFLQKNTYIHNMQCFHEFASMWTVNAKYKNNFLPDIFRAAFQSMQNISKGFQSNDFKRVSKGFQSVSKEFQKRFQRLSNPQKPGFLRVSE